MTFKEHWFCRNTILVLESQDADRHHISLSHKKRLPTWDEVKIVREKLCDNTKFYVMVLPPSKYYVNLHEYCFHLWEVKSEDEIEVWKQM